MRPRRELPKFHALRSVCSCLRGTNRQRHRRSNGQDKMRQKRLTGLDADLREPISIRCGGIVEAVGAGWALVACAEEHAARQPHLPPFIRALSLSTCTRPTLAAARGWNLRVQHSCCGPKASATAGAACAAFFASARAVGLRQVRYAACVRSQRIWCRHLQFALANSRERNGASLMIFPSIMRKDTCLGTRFRSCCQFQFCCLL